VVRDWVDDDDYSFGWDGGEKYFRESTEPDQNQAAEHRMRQKYFRNTFGHIPCLLLPYPGAVVRSGDVCKFGGQ